MPQNLDLKEIERRVHQSVFQDGLMEIMMGGFLLVFGASLAMDMKWIPLIISLLVVISMGLGMAISFTPPRITPTPTPTTTPTTSSNLPSLALVPSR